MTDAVSTLLERFSKNYDEGSVTQGVLLDFSNMFDTN